MNTSLETATLGQATLPPSRPTPPSASNTLSRREWLAIFDVLNGSISAMLEAGHLSDVRPMGALAFSLLDAKEDGLYEKWVIDGPGLVAKIQAMSASEVAAVYYASATFWEMDERLSTDERLDAVIERYNSNNGLDYFAPFQSLSTYPVCTKADIEVLEAEARLRELAWTLDGLLDEGFDSKGSV